MDTFPASFDVETFMQKHWQQQPLVIRQCFVPFIDPVDEHDLAGLAMETDVDSRIISHRDDGNWTVTQGPFDDFSDHCQGAWTLLVQGVDRWVEPVAELLEAFRFIPYWRMDDVMVSYAVPGAGVGAHVDQYDVFLVQGKGRRHWQVGRPGHTTALMPHPNLCQVAPFAPVIDCILEPGDVLYIPPGWPHKGETLDAALTYSIGFRAPDQLELANVLLDALHQPDNLIERFTDAKRSAPQHASTVSEQDISALRQMLHRAIDTEDFTHSLLCALSESKPPESEQHYADELVTGELLQQQWDEQRLLVRDFGLRPLLAAVNGPADMRCFLNGDAINVPARLQAAFTSLCESPKVPLKLLKNYQHDVEFLQILATLINKGYWALE